jgi:predicted nucleic acid-binding protein
MLLIDTSLWVPIFRDPSGATARRVQVEIGTEPSVFCQFIRAELLQGCRDQGDWDRSLLYLDEQEYRELSSDGWTEAARIYFDLRQQGLTVRSTLDCCIALVAIQHDLTLFHDDYDYQRIATVRPLKHKRIDVGQ